jgi:predicted permease
LSNVGDGSYFIDHVPEQRDRTRDPRALFTIVSPGAFAALSIPITRGRDFDDGDTEDRPLVAIVNETLVRESMAGQEPIGRTLFCSFDRKEGMTIIGVVGDVRQRHPGQPPMPDCYMPYRQHSYNNNTLMVAVRTTGEPLALAGTVRRVAAEIAPEVPVSFTTMDATISKRMEDPRFLTFLFAVFAGLAVCLAVAGVYGVMAYAVGQRSKELSLRLALGASRGMVLRQILGQGLVVAGVGVAVGLAAAAAAALLLRRVLFDVQPIDVQVYLGVAVLVGLVTVMAGYLPARRASSVDPVELLKSE